MEILNIHTEHLVKVIMTSYRKGRFFFSLNLNILFEDLEGQRKEEGRILWFFFFFILAEKMSLVISKSCSREPHGCPHGQRLPTPTLIRESRQASFFFFSFSACPCAFENYLKRNLIVIECLMLFFFSQKISHGVAFQDSVAWVGCGGKLLDRFWGDREFLFNCPAARWIGPATHLAGPQFLQLQ